MDDSTLTAPPAGESPRNAEEQALIQMFLTLPAEQMVQYLRLLQHWAQAPGGRKAIAVKLRNAELTGKDVARLCGLSDRQLRRYPEYRALSRLLGKEGNRPPRGAKGSDGGVEAWDG